jgi:biotin-(acetyl-CoA carboxylase) ligase
MSQLSASAIAAGLTTRRLGRPALFFPSIGSTNDVIHAAAAAGAAEGLLAVADEQTAGRGRLDRRWWAPAGSSLLMSLLLRPPIPAVRAGQLTMCLGLGAAEGIEQTTGLRPALKWPNDLLLAGRKLGGMLTELRLDGDRLEYAVLGLGVNVNVEFGTSPPAPAPKTAVRSGVEALAGCAYAPTKPSEGSTPVAWRLSPVRAVASRAAWASAPKIVPPANCGRSPTEPSRSLPGWAQSETGPSGESDSSGAMNSLAWTAISLSLALGRPVERLPLLVAILARCEAWYDRMLAGESPHQAWAGRLDTLGRAVTVTLPSGALVGTAIGVNAEGALLVRDEDGQIHTVWAGDVTAVR